MTTTDLYVSTTGSDSNSGTQASPFKTILAASRAAQAGTTVHVAAGTYDGGFQTTASGTAGNPIHYVSDTKWGAIIVPGANSTGDTAWDNRGAYVAIDGFQVDGTHYQSGTAWVQGIYSAGSNSVIENNSVHNIAQNASTSTSGSAIALDGYYGATHIDAIANVVHDIGPTGGSLIQGIYQATSGNVENNLVDNVSGYGIHLWHDANHVNIVNNTVFNNHSGGILVGGGDFHTTSGPDDYDYVANNIVHNNANSGVAEWGRTGTHNIYTHNLSYNNTGSYGNWYLQNGNTHTNDMTAGTTSTGTINYNNPALSAAAWQAYSKAEITTQTVVLGTTGADYLKGSNTSSTILYGGDGQDHLVGHNAPTEFIGGYGRDFLWGGAGKNTFTYLSAADSTLLHPDGIGNFHDSQDVIDLHFLTAADNPGAPNHRPLSFIGSNAFTGAGNEVHVIENVAKNETDVEADLSGHGQADLHIQIVGLHHLGAANFWL